jgi:hypothetical protein
VLHALPMSCSLTLYSNYTWRRVVCCNEILFFLWVYSPIQALAALDTHWIGVSVGPRTGLDNVERRKICTYRDSISDPRPSSQ